MFFSHHKSVVTNLALILMLLGGIFGTGTVESVQAAALIVENVNDSGPGSLRQAITNAISGDTITFNSTLAGQTIVLASALPTIDKTLGIDGGGQSIAVDGASRYQIFQVAATGHLILNHLTLQNGRGSQCIGVDFDGYTCGGAIYNVLGNLTITNSTFSGNSARGGGAIFMDNGIANITNSTFSGNSGTYGGGILNWTGTVNVSNSTFFGNLAAYGGGIYNDVGFLALVNSTFSGNSGDSGSLHNDAGTVSLTNSILANSVSGSDCYNNGEYAEISVNAGNLIEVNTASPNNCSMPALTADPLLGSLADNGGSTQTMELLPGSPAIDAVDNTSCPATDQRGMTRPQGDGCDLGAYEFDAPEKDNLVFNPGFEMQGNSTSDAANWMEGVDHTRASDKFHTGGWALHSTFHGAGTDTRTTAPIAVSANTTYAYSGYIWRTNSTGAACMDMNDIAGERQLCASTSGSWQSLTGTWNSGSTTSVTLRLITDGSPTGDIWFDEISLKKVDTTPTATQISTFTPTPTATQTATPMPIITSTLPVASNLVLNPGFEMQGNSTSDAANWREGTNHTRASDKFHTGGWALHSKFRGVGTDTHSAAPITVRSNTTYTYSGYIWRTNSTGAACMDMNDIPGERQLCASTTGKWQFLTGTWNSGSNTSVTLRLITDGSPTGDIWFDDISLK